MYSTETKIIYKICPKITYISPFLHHLSHSLLQTELFGCSFTDTFKLFQIWFQIQVYHLSQSCVLQIS